MRSDFSALDAQLDALSTTPAFDVVALARGYAGALDALSAVDDALATLEAGVDLPELPAPNPNLVRRVDEVRDQIELPEPIREPMTTFGLEFEIADSEMPITARHDVEPLEGSDGFQTRESGAFTVYDEKSPHDSSVTNAPRMRNARGRDDSRDITMEPMDGELVEAELDDLRPEAALLGSIPGSLFDLRAPVNAEAEIEADAAFAALFAEATRQSSMPASETETADDTQVFSVDPGSVTMLPSNLPFDVALTNPAAASEDSDELEPGFHDETLDSAEFEIVNDVVTDARPANAASQSRPPEKRPSFLGRLFGRKDE